MDGLLYLAKLAWKSQEHKIGNKIWLYMVLSLAHRKNHVPSILSKKTTPTSCMILKQNNQIIILTFYKENKTSHPLYIKI